MTRSHRQSGPPQRNLEHVFTLLSAVLPREPLQVAYHGIRSADVALRGLAVEYLDGVLPVPLRAKLWALVDAAPRPTAERPPPEEVLEELRRSAQLPIVRPDAAATPSSGDVLEQSDPPRTARATVNATLSQAKTGTATPSAAPSADERQPTARRRAA